eukprot:TRINITY_DN7191_c0_g1_i1.p1 TRINITY_DN7191_c0_g1~~TRINITY_DN7191_c0_g1_i1.p1  ORF type:complete len:188 (+),score=4.54 TRINITY_DN7191_c0_g1_i1:250-813(+)
MRDAAAGVEGKEVSSLCTFNDFPAPRVCAHDPERFIYKVVLVCNSRHHVRRAHDICAPFVEVRTSAPVCSCLHESAFIARQQMHCLTTHAKANPNPNPTSDHRVTAHRFVQWRTDVTTEYLDETTQHEEAGEGAAPAAPAAVAGPQPFVGGPVSQEWVSVSACRRSFSSSVAAAAAVRGVQRATACC